MNDTARTRQRSAALFGNEKTAEVIVELGRASGAVTAQEVSAALTIGHGLVRAVMRRLVGGDLVRQLPKTGGTRSAQYYEVIRGPAWDAFQSAAKSLITHSTTNRLG